MRARGVAIVLLMVLAGFTGTGVAAQHHITPEPEGRAAGLTAAIRTAVPGDTLCLQPGVYRGSFILERGVSLLGVAGADSTVLDADGERYVLFAKNLDSTTVIQGFTIQNGRRDHPNSGGGGIYLHRSSPIVTGNVFRNHLGYLGPGVYANYDSNPVIAYNEFHDNEGYLGGAIAAYQDCAPFIYNNVLRANRAVSGGAILCQNSAAVIVNNTMVANRASPGGGGAIYCNASPAFIARNVMAGNFDSRADGGAVYWLDNLAPATLRDNLVWENEGGGEGGACPPFLAANGNCEADPEFIPGGVLRATKPASCLPAAGAAAWNRGTVPAVPDSLLELWRAWRRAHR